MRQLAAIMFSDMLGYTALMQENEELAINKRQKLKEVLETCVAEHNGKILQYYGDGALSMFGSAVDCVTCAVQIQQRLQRVPKVDLRIGIHLGDITVDNDTVYGDGVNLASRIESMAVPGSIIISEKVFDEIKNHDGLTARPMGYFEFKNVKEPIRIFAIEKPGLVVPAREALKGKTRQPSNRLAVLPFVNMSADPENEYFSDGIAEDLLNALTKVDGLQVTSRTSAFAFKGKDIDIREIGTQLNVDRILEGSVRKAGNRVRITAQLINTGDGYHIWSEVYDRNLTDIFEVQDEISMIIANKLRENLAPKDSSSRSAKVAAPNIDAYTLFLKGLHFHNKITPKYTKKAIDFFQQAIALQPDYPLAYAMAATGYASLGATGQMHPAEAFAVVHRYSDKALQLDPELAAGYCAKGAAYLLYDWKWSEAYACLTQAIELRPTTTEAHQLLSLYYQSTGRKKEAVDIMEKALEVDALSPIVNQYLADAYSNAGRTDDALKQIDRLLELYPNMRVAMESKGWCTGRKGDWKKAAEIFEDIHKKIKNPLKGLAPLGCAYGYLGEREKALACIAKIEQRQVEEPGTVLDIDLAMIWWSLKEKDKAFYHLFKCVEKKMGVVAILIDHPIFKDVQSDPRYQLLKEQLHLDAYPVTS